MTPAALLTGKVSTNKLVDDKGKVLLQKGTKLDDAAFDAVPRKYWGHIELEKGKEKIDAILAQLEEQVTGIETLFQEKIAKLSKDVTAFCKARKAPKAKDMKGKVAPASRGAITTHGLYDAL